MLRLKTWYYRYGAVAATIAAVVLGKKWGGGAHP